MPRTEAHLARHTNQKLKGVSFAVIGAIFGVPAVFSLKHYLPMRE